MTPEMKERVLETVNELIDCCDKDFCTCDADSPEETPWDDEGHRDVSDDRRDILREREWDRD